MRDGEQRDARILGRLVDLALHVDRHRARALVQQRELRPGFDKNIMMSRFFIHIIYLGIHGERR